MSWQCRAELCGSDHDVHGGIVSGWETLEGVRRPLPGLLDFSPLPATTVLLRSVPLYGWKVTRRDRAVASGRQAGRQRSSDRGIACEPDGRRWIGRQGEGAAEAGTEPRAERHEA